MRNILKDKIKANLLKKHRSAAETSIVPLSKIKSAAVYVDSSDLYSDECVVMVKSYFEGKNIPVTIYSVQTGILNFVGDMCGAKTLCKFDGMGRFRGKTTIPEGKEDLLVSLVGRPVYAVDYASCVSKARFKVSRAQLPGNVFDFVLTGSEGHYQKDVFVAMTDILEKIR